MTESRDARFIRLYVVEGLSCRQIAAKERAAMRAITNQGVWWVLRQHGIAMRSANRVRKEGRVPHRKKPRAPTAVLPCPNAPGWPTLKDLMAGR